MHPSTNNPNFANSFLVYYRGMDERVREMSRSAVGLHFNRFVPEAEMQEINKRYDLAI